MQNTFTQSTTSNISRGIGLTVLSVIIFGSQDAAAKILVQDYAVPQVVMMRYWAFGAFSVFLALRQNGFRRAFQAKYPVLQIVRGLLLLADILLFARAVRTLPLGELSSIMLLFPIVVTVLAIPLLGEKVGLLRWSSVVAGFIGVLIILRPGLAVIDTGAFYALGAVMAFSLYTIFTRMVAGKDHTATSMLYVGVTGLVLSSIVGVFYWQPLTIEAWGLMVFLWLTTTGGHFLVMRALAYAPASVVQPFNYLMLPWAIILSFVIFGHLIDFVSLVGALVIVGAGLVVWVRERQKTAVG